MSAKRCVRVRGIHHLGVRQQLLSPSFLPRKKSTMRSYTSCRRFGFSTSWSWSGSSFAARARVDRSQVCVSKVAFSVPVPFETPSEPPSARELSPATSPPLCQSPCILTVRVHRCHLSRRSVLVVLHPVRRLSYLAPIPTLISSIDPSLLMF